MDWFNLHWGLIAFVPLAVLAGWQLARRGPGSHRDAQRRVLSPEYFKGLNYVLNEQPDKAIEIFIKMLDLDSEMVDMHMAVASLFRRRGEVDRAIRIHQNLIARPNLDQEQHALALLELGSDYMRAGLLDRAEKLFQELNSTGRHSLDANRHLLDIYQQEKEWHKAITVASDLEQLAGSSMSAVIAQFHCELACIEREQGNVGAARDYVLRSLDFDPRCVRASMLEAELCMHKGKYEQALTAYQRVETQDSEYLAEVVRPLLECYRRVRRVDECMRYLRGVVERHGDVSALLVWADLIAQKHGEDEAMHHISKALDKHPTVRGVDRLVDLMMSRAGGALQDSLGAVKSLTKSLSLAETLHKCVVCGFDAKALHWQCPSCKNWNTIKPARGGRGA